MPRYHRVLVTGAAGNLGRELRAKLAGFAPVMRYSDRDAMPAAGPDEEVIRADLADAGAIETVCEDVDAIVHLGGQATEGPWATVMAANIAGAVNLWEGARKAGVKRVLFASSNHAIGFHRRTERLDHTSPAWPDSRYGLSKAFGEDISRYYAFKHGIEGFCMRIGSCFPAVTNARMLSTWLSYADFVRLVKTGLEAEYLYEIVYGVSRNTRGWWDNSNAYRLGYDPQDDAEQFAAEVEHLVSHDPLDEARQGGMYVPPDFTGDAARLP